MSISEAEDHLGITESDKVDCPFGDCENCKKGLNPETCEEMYEEWLMEKLSEVDDDE